MTSSRPPTPPGTSPKLSRSILPRYGDFDYSGQLVEPHKPATAAHTPGVTLVVQDGVPFGSNKMVFPSRAVLRQMPPSFSESPQITQSSKQRISRGISTQSTNPNLRKMIIDFFTTARHFCSSPPTQTTVKISPMFHRNSARSQQFSEKGN